MSESASTHVARPGARPPEPTADEYHDDIIYPQTIPFVIVHLVCLAAIWTGVTTTAVVIAIVLYVVRMFGTTAGYHRYFSHRSFRTSRVFQFVLAFLAQSSAQRGALWWAAKHRHHHRHSDTELDIHSPRHRGFWYSHVGWIFKPRQGETDMEAVADLAKYPELVWLDRHYLVSPTILALACFLVAGWPGLIVGFFWSTVVLFHGTFMINSLAHVHGKQRYVTGDDSRNNWWLALITLGEGWHNNHHAYQRSTRQGFRWWEIDITFYILSALSWAGVVWELGAPPADLVRNERRLGRAVVEKVAHQLAGSFEASRIAAQLREAWAQTPTLQEMRDRVAAGHLRAEALLADVHLPQLPTVAEVRARAEQMYASSPSMDEIVARARELIVQAISVELFPVPEATGAA
ncbi:MAG TPA: acyl-CoA desaturase [Gemmatimonadaceae bacterium]|nr:acyl-CoA desaturase [Gemmatimonadaceae bacterium]